MLSALRHKTKRTLFVSSSSLQVRSVHGRRSGSLMGDFSAVGVFGPGTSPRMTSVRAHWTCHSRRNLPIVQLYLLVVISCLISFCYYLSFYDTTAVGQYTIYNVWRSISWRCQLRHHAMCDVTDGTGLENDHSTAFLASLLSRIEPDQSYIEKVVNNILAE